jgi:hypothetical protein
LAEAALFPVFYPSFFVRRKERVKNMPSSISPATSDPVAPSLYDLLLKGAPLLTVTGQRLPKTITLAHLSGRTGIPVAIDNGDYRAKMVVADAKSNQLVTNAVIVATGPAERARTKVARTTYRVRNLSASPSSFSQEFLIGRAALEHCDSESLSLGVGATEERLSSTDSRQLHFLLASLTESLRLAHYPADTTYFLVLGFAAPNEEFELGSFREASAVALELLDGQTFEVERIRQEGKVRQADKYLLYFAETIPTPQTAGAWTALNYGLDGTLIPSRLVEETLVDFGGGHTQFYRVRRITGESEVELVGTGGRLGVGKGSINLARIFTEAMREKYSNLAMSDITSQVAIADGSIVVHGVRRRLDEVIDTKLLEEATERLLVDVLQILQQDSSQVGFVGGGLENAMLYELLKRRTERRKDGLFFVDRSLTSLLNAYGTYLAALFDSINRNREYAGEA